MKLLSDFDGVWTNPDAEAAAQGAWLDRQLIAWAPPERRAETARTLAAARAAVQNDPARYGWAPAGRLSAFGDEDPFAHHSALLHYLHLEAPRDASVAQLRDSILANGFESLEAFGGQAHAQGVAEVAASRGPGILPAAASAGRAMLDAGIDIVVVSNSGTDKLVRWFEHAGLPTCVHPERTPRALRLRGAARKFVLDPERSDLLAVGALTVDVARPAYATILTEERPDAVVGDVFSLDLALPLALKRRDRAWHAVRLFWLVCDETPARIRRELERAAAGEIEPIEGGLAGVAAALGAAR